MNRAIPFLLGVATLGGLIALTAASSGQPAIHPGPTGVQVIHVAPPIATAGGAQTPTLSLTPCSATQALVPIDGGWGCSTSMTLGVALTVPVANVTTGVLAEKVIISGDGGLNAPSILTDSIRAWNVARDDGGIPLELKGTIASDRLTPAVIIDNAVRLSSGSATVLSIRNGDAGEICSVSGTGGLTAGSLNAPTGTVSALEVDTTDVYVDQTVNVSGYVQTGYLIASSDAGVTTPALTVGASGTPIHGIFHATTAFGGGVQAYNNNPCGLKIINASLPGVAAGAICLVSTNDAERSAAMSGGVMSYSCSAVTDHYYVFSCCMASTTQPNDAGLPGCYYSDTTDAGNPYPYSLTVLVINP